MKDLLFTFDSFCKAGALILTRRSEDATPSGGSDYYLFDPNYMQNAANNGEIFSYQFKGHADNVRGLKVFIRAPEKNMLLFRQSNYNYRLGQNKNLILNIFRLF
jgi:hypothetical protein